MVVAYINGKLLHCSQHSSYLCKYVVLFYPFSQPNMNGPTLSLDPNEAIFDSYINHTSTLTNGADEYSEPLTMKLLHVKCIFIKDSNAAVRCIWNVYYLGHSISRHYSHQFSFCSTFRLSELKNACFSAHPQVFCCSFVAVLTCIFEHCAF